MGRPRDPVTGRFLPGGGSRGGGKKSKSRAPYPYWQHYAPYAPPPPPPPQRRRRRSHGGGGGLNIGFKDIVKAAEGRNLIQRFAARLEARGGVFGLSGQEAATMAAYWWAKKHHDKDLELAAILEGAPLLEEFLGGEGGPPQLPSPQAPPQLPAQSSAEGGGESTAQTIERGAETGLEGLGLGELAEWALMLATGL